MMPTDTATTSGPEATPSGWTGLQYSAYRVGVALAVFQLAAARLPLLEGRPWPLLALGLPGAFALALGWRDRAVATALLVVVCGIAAFVDGAPLVLPEDDVLFTALALFLHLFSPITPFGSWDAAGRIDPRGDWFRPSWLGHLGWSVLALVQLVRWATDAGPSLGFGTTLVSRLPAQLLAWMGLAALPALFVPRLRPFVWIAITLGEIAASAAAGWPDGSWARLLVHLFAADPGWWPGRRFHLNARADRQPARLFYDGDCGFCHRSVRILLSEEANTPEADRFRFAPLSSETFAAEVERRDDLDPATLPDSIVLILEDGQLLTRSGAAIECASRLGGLWRGLALTGAWIPEPVRDGLYDAIARVRKRLVENPTGACPILPPDLRSRFDV